MSAGKNRQRLKAHEFLPVRPDVGSHPTTVRTCHPRSKSRHPHLARPFVYVDDPLVKALLARYQESAHTRRAHAANRSGSRRAHKLGSSDRAAPWYIGALANREALRMPRRSPANSKRLGPPSQLEFVLFWIVGTVVAIASGGVAIYADHYHLWH
jgi:hypothetical protein